MYVNEDDFVLPVNAELSDSRIVYHQNYSHAEYLMMLLEGNVHGSNYFNNDYKEVCVLMKGEGRSDAYTQGNIVIDRAEGYIYVYTSCKIKL